MEYLNKRFSSQNCGIAYIYFDAQDQEHQTAQNVFASLLKQLVLHSKAESPTVNHMYKQHNVRKTMPDLNELVKCIISVCALFSDAYIILDALDEAKDNCLRKVLTGLQDVKVLATGRTHIASRAYFTFSSTMEIQAKDDDIRRYLEINLMERNMTDQLRQQIITKLSSKTKGV